MSEPAREPLELEYLLTDDQRRPVTVDEHAAFRASMIPALPRRVDPIDELVEELRQLEKPTE